jgi:hypothetical protein
VVVLKQAFTVRNGLPARGFKLVGLNFCCVIVSIIGWLRSTVDRVWRVSCHVNIETAPGAGVAVSYWHCEAIQCLLRMAHCVLRLWILRRCEMEEEAS